MHGKYTLKVIEAFAMHEKLQVVCANCGKPLITIERKEQIKKLLIELSQAVLFGSVVFYLSYKAFLKFFPLIIR